jgi:RHH-type proline utilization regulon transcriptional repressor/proline dehydrogenase/delta 1-pyrroline-5-carboxylate dehydrogenase
MATRPDTAAPARSSAPLPSDGPLEESIRAAGLDLLSDMEQHPTPGILSAKGAYARLMEWSLRDPAFKAQLFRFVDVLPALDSAGEVIRHLREYLGESASELHPVLKAGLGAARLAPALAAGPVRSQVTAMARQFVAGETVDDLMRRFRENAAAGMATTIDLLGEAVLTEAEGDVFLRRNLEVLDSVAKAIAGEPPSRGDVGPDGRAEPRVNLSVKPSGLSPDAPPEDPESAIAALSPRLRTILRRAAETGAFVNIDMESYRWKDLTLALFKSILEEPEFRSGPAVGIAIQAYLRETEEDLRALIDWARRRGRRIGVRLVKGAYWDTEVVLARQRGWPVPVFTQKAETDLAYERLTTLLLENVDVVVPALATHNVRSAAHAIARARRLGVDPRAYEFQALYGMADDLKGALVKTGQRVREYCTIGALLPGMAYLVRRLLENTSNEGFLRRRHAGVEAAKLLASPAETLRAAAPEAKPPAPPPAFTNAPGADFTQAAARARMRAALDEVGAELGRRWPLVIGGREVKTKDELVSVNPARPSQVIGICGSASAAEADQAVATARAAFPAWAATPPEERAAILERAADLIEERRFRFDALMVLEAGKPWPEADVEVSEAIDFCRFYAAEMRRLGVPRRTQEVAGELCTESFVPRGVGVAIAPWNFPLAILTGLTVAPLVAGNAVVMKPSEETPVLGAWLAAVLFEAGLPPGVLAYLPGPGATAGARLCEHPGTDFIAFTGSREVGTGLWQVAGRTVPGQANLKKMVCEMGGKNALVVDDDADLDEAIPAILHSAFGFAGQKCSACSRVIALPGVHDHLLERLVAACRSLRVGDPAQPGTSVGPVIGGEAREKIRGYLEQGKREARLVYQAELPAALVGSGGFYVPPTIFADVEPGHVIAREEIFGPVLAVLRARDLDHAFALANGVDYALTGGLFSRSPSALERARRELLVGNLYLNRGITGAIVERHPFGGFKMSGGGTKAGGRGYLENFMFPRVVAENVLRRGFAPEE